jgi:hypothetical protein
MRRRESQDRAWRGAKGHGARIERVAGESQGNRVGRRRHVLVRPGVHVLSDVASHHRQCDDQRGDFGRRRCGSRPVVFRAPARPVARAVGCGRGRRGSASNTSGQFWKGRWRMNQTISMERQPTPPPVGHGPRVWAWKRQQRFSAGRITICHSWQTVDYPLGHYLLCPRPRVRFEATKINL